MCEPSCPSRAPCPGHTHTVTTYCAPAHDHSWLGGAALAAAVVILGLAVLGWYVSPHPSDCGCYSGQQIANYGGNQTVIENHY